MFYIVHLTLNKYITKLPVVYQNMKDPGETVSLVRLTLQQVRPCSVQKRQLWEHLLLSYTL